MSEVSAPHTTVECLQHADGRHTCIKTEEVQKELYLGVVSAEFDAIEKSRVPASNKFVVISLC